MSASSRHLGTGESCGIWAAALEEKEALLASDPRKFFTTAHHDGYPTFLVREFDER